MDAASATEPAAPTAAPGPLRSLYGAWDLLRADPIGLLLPVGGRLLIEVLGAMALRGALGGPWQPLVATVAAWWLARAVLGAPLRSRMLAVAVRARGRSAASWGRPLALLGTELIVGPASLGPGLGVGLGGLAASLVVLSEGWVATSSVLLACTTVAAVTLSVAVRAIFATAGIEAVTGRSGLGALRAAATAGPRTLGTAFVLLVVGDTATALGALACGALVLVGYPIADLAIADRWLSDRRSA